MQMHFNIIRVLIALGRFVAVKNQVAKAEQTPDVSKDEVCYHTLKVDIRTCLLQLFSGGAYDTESSPGIALSGRNGETEVLRWVGRDGAW